MSMRGHMWGHTLSHRLSHLVSQWVLGFLLFSGSVWAQQYVISTVAGGATPASPTAGVKASVGDPTRIAVDAAGSVYFSSLHSVFKVDSAGTMTRVAGNGRVGNLGDGGPATAAQLMFPMGIAIDAAGNVYVADRDASVVRRIGPGGIIQTVAGNGTAGYLGDGGKATAAQLNSPFAVAVNGSGLYIADTNNAVIRKVAPDGTISTYAGSGTIGYFGDGGQARNAQFNGPEGVALDASGTLYIADTFNGRIRRVGSDGLITTAVGVGTTGIYGGDNGPPANAGLGLPPDVAVDRLGNLYIADFGNSRIRLVANAVITTVAGTDAGAPIFDGLEALNVRLAGPTGVAVDRNGAFYFVEAGIGSGTGLARGDHRVWKVSSAGVLTTVAGNGLPNYGGDNGAATAAQLDTPTGVAVDASGNVLISDTLNHRVRKVTRGTIMTVAGTGAAGFNGEVSPPGSARLNTPRGLAVDGQGDYFVADTGNNRVREVQPGGNLFGVAGNGNASYFGDGTAATRASINQPEGVAVDARGNIYIADTLDNVIREVTADGAINTIAGFGTPGFGGDGGPAIQAKLNGPRGVAVDTQGNVYVADSGNGRVRKIDGLGNITTLGDAGIGDFVLAGSAAGPLVDPRGVAVDRAGNVFVTDFGANRVYRIATSGTMTTIAGDGTCCYAGDGGLGTAAQLNHPYGVAVDAAGNVYVADSGNNAVRVLAPVSATMQVNAVTNAASNLAGAIAPGELVVLYGTGLGAVQAVLFNGVPGPLLYATPGQVGAVVPYGVSGGSVQVVAQGAGTSSAPVSVTVAATAPGVFTADGSGRGQAAAVNQDGTPNGAGAAAAAGSVVLLYATGEGQTSPAGVDGKTAGTVLPAPVAVVTVQIGGVAADVRYAGGAPGIIAGVMQVNAVVPGGVTGNAPVVVTVGGVSSQGGVTVAVR